MVYAAPMKASHWISFVCGALVTLGITTMVSQSQAQSPSHVYELRMYHTNPGKMDALNKRFKDATDRIFLKHDMHAIGYWIPQDTPNLYVYVLEHPSREAATKDWAAFNADPEWVKAKAASEVDGKLVDHVDDYYLTPTEYSRLK